jgi:ferric-dicitrate binding protein FerR (iron transport regulator)
MRRVRISIALALLLAAPGIALGADVGAIASVTGHAEVGRSGQWTPATAGMGVQLGDELRTKDGRMRVVFQDDSTLNLAENTTLVVDDQVFQPEQSTFKSLMKVIRGKVRATVGSVYQKPGATYEIETPTAVAGVRGTTFLVSYDEADNTTEVLGIRGKVHVRGLSERLGDGVFVTSRELTEIGKGEGATKPEMMDEQLYRQRLEGLEILSRRGLGGLASGLALTTGSAVPVPDRAPMASSKLTTGLDDLPNAADVVGQPLVQGNRGSLGVPF